MIQDLINYQIADADLKAIENTLSGSEERKKAVSAKKYLDGVEENVNKLDSRAASLAAEYEKTLADLKKLGDQQGEIATALESVSGESEAAYLIKKAEELIAKTKNLSAAAKNLSAEIQNVMKEYVTIKNTTKAAQAQYNENGKKYNDLKASLADKKAAAEAKLEELKKKVEPELMEKYLKKRAGKMYPIVYEVTGDICGACNMQLSMAELSRLKNGEIIEHECGRIIYKKQ